MDSQPCYDLLNRGEFLANSEPSGKKDGRTQLVSRIRAWILEADSLNGDCKTMPFKLGVLALKQRLETMERILNEHVEPEE